ncbi:MAG TPA: hypothetical protein VGN20_22825 [Mucilaginibacter sp.]|jgi:hypothetical protein
MKKILFIILVLGCSFLASGQTLTQNINNRLLQKKDTTEKVLSLSLVDFDFFQLFLHTNNSVIYGFIGDNYQRIRMKFIKITKNQSSADTYLVYGKSMVKNNICEFRGTITISDLMRYKKISYGVDDEYKNRGIKGQYVILGNYSFSENKTQAHSGIFKGMFQSNFYLDKNNKVHYDDIGMSDGFANNQFIGEWTSFKDNLAKKCNWGDFRIPDSGDLDIGVGDFSPDDKYLKYGWQSIRDISISNSEAIENAKWWK